MTVNISLHLNKYQAAYEQALEKARAERVIERIWARDHTLWAPLAAEISNRLGWLDIAERMQAEIPALETFAAEARAAGFRKALLLGMGGSSLAPELYAALFGSDDGLALSILDSTDPTAVLAAAVAHPPEETLYIISSKSGGTVETLSFFKYFYNGALDALGPGRVGGHFIAITDPGSGLAGTAERYGFRRAFLADPDIGGRYSALSHFGLVPAALLGADLPALLASAAAMAERCKAADPADNPGTQLGLAMGALALAGRDKLTISLDERRGGFADWAEQLIAESTGKAGHGILPVVREAALPAERYGADRAFVYFGDGTSNGEHVGLHLDWGSNADLGAQFFVWQFATAVAGWLLGVNPFDQPDVEAAKVGAREFLREYEQTGALPQGESAPPSQAALQDFLARAKPGDYIAIQAYLAQTPGADGALAALRRQLSEETGLATTLGYGPRFLHSTGQLHKGDAGNGLFVQLLNAAPQPDLAIPDEAGKPGSGLGFGTLLTAQAAGDAAALRAAGRRVLSFHIEGEIDTALKSLLP
ncbi:MAG: hypothetical protein KIS85_04110 [Anaerolineales bacterium]|nr:hypothetical protein [Anaerolineales bacterium]